MFFGPFWAKIWVFPEILHRTQISPYLHFWLSLHQYGVPNKPYGGQTFLCKNNYFGLYHESSTADMMHALLIVTLTILLKSIPMTIRQLVLSWTQAGGPPHFYYFWSYFESI